MAKRVSRRAGAALRGLRSGAGLRIGAVGLNLMVAGQAAFFPLSGVVSITSNSASSTSWTLRRSASPRTARRRSISRRLALRRLSAMVVRRSIRSIESRFSTSASAMRASMLLPASVRSSWTTVTASGSRRSYCCTSSFALWARASRKIPSMDSPPRAKIFLSLSGTSAPF